MDSNCFVSWHDRLIDACSQAILGKRQELSLIAACYLCGGHVLLEDVPGTGKTMLLRAFARATGGSFRRIQFTPDVTPSDITGINFYNLKQGEFEFRPGPLFANMVLADEINRATPRTQSSLLEAMAEGQISVDGVTHPLAGTFMVAATQNPIESYGTFPLPEAQMDRFMMRLSLGYMPREAEMQVALRRDTADIVGRIEPCVTEQETLALRERLDEIELSETVLDYLMRLIEKTRSDERIRIGASPRGTIALCKTARAWAAFHGRCFVLPEDVQFLAPYVLTHRLHYRTSVHSAEASEIFASLLAQVSVPTEARG